ncbi:MAG: response regulator [Oscillospiraceae bacterium]|jgi:two-component system response regulator YesN|nr:response regulator [Oscillospiraceae bacterium]
MRRLLLADDEPATRRGILSGVPWASLGVTEIMEACDGVDALRLARLNPPDVVITDVRMPRLNGIELAMELRKTMPSVKIIFISGYSDKEYLRAAIRLGAVGYVEKPIDLDEITQAVRRVGEQADTRPGGDFLLLVREDMASRLLKPGADALGLERGMSLLGLRFGLDAWYLVMIIKLDGDAELPRDWARRFGEMWPELVLCGKDGLIVAVARSDTRSGLLNDRDDMLAWIRGQADAGLAFTAVGQPARGMANIHVSYEQAVVALQSFFFTGYGQAVFYRENGGEVVPECLEKPFLDALAGGRYDELERRARRLCAELAREPHMLVDHAKQLFARLLLALRSEAGRRRAPADSPRGPDDGWLLDALSGRKTLAQYQDLLLDATRSFIEDEARSAPTAHRKVTAAMRVIESQYMDPNLCVNSLAEQVRLTQPYLSMLFKKTVGRSISECLLELRVEKSKRILVEEDIRLSEVARRVGYNDTNTYAKAFKRATGVSPARFRQKGQR